VTLSAILPGDEILSGAEFCEREHDAFEELSDVQIVMMVQTDDADIVCSDEDEDYVPSGTTVASALLHIQQLQEFALSRPELFTLESVRALHIMHHDLQRHRSQQQRAGSITPFFARV
jgi:hypothetical protein